MRLIVIGGPNDGERHTISETLARGPGVCLPEPAGGDFAFKRRQTTYALVWLRGIDDIVFAVLPGAGDPELLLLTIVAGYKQIPRCNCGSTYFCRMCGRELGE